jgi:hypothetical protein
MAAHCRFYAPALPFFFTAALRGQLVVSATWKKVSLVLSGVGASGVALYAFRHGWVETRLLRFGLAHQYIHYFVGTTLVGALLLCPRGLQKWAVLAASLVIAAHQILATAPPVAGVTSDAEADLAVYSTNSGQVGIEVILRCFEEPLQIMHSELGIPGVLFPESRILDFTGLANPAVVHETFDFEQVCNTDRPEFIFRPHPTHERLNRNLDASPCFASRYVRVKPRRHTSCPLYVRKDLLAKFVACQG